MGYEPKLIAPFVNSGLQKYFKPWITGDEAFPEIKNAYAWRGNVRKREGMRILASLPAGDKPIQGIKNWINPSTLAESLVCFSKTKAYLFNNVALTFADITFLANPAGTAFSFSNGDNDYYWSSNFAGSLWITNNLTADHIRFWNGTPGAVGVSGGWSVHQPTVNGTTTLDASVIILPYKGRLVVLNTNEGGNSFPSRARWSQLGTPYTSNVAGVSITNITAANPAVVSVGNTTGFVIGQNAGITNVVGSMGAKLNQRQFNVSAINPGVSISIDVNTTGLVYTSGGLAQGPGTTTPPSPFKIDIFAWRDDIPGKGGFIDADTNERIVSAEIVKDTLIVFFQRSTWRLRYTGNEILPFIWERLNTQFGAESTFSNVGFDDAALAFSRFGWIGADTNDAARIDLAIPDDSFSIESIDATFTGLSHVQGIRDFYRQFAYWTYLTIGQTVNNQIYAYNYIDKTWAIFQPQLGASNGIKTFGLFRTNTDLTWSTFNQATDTWENYNSPDDVWSSFGAGTNANFPFVVGGDYNGNIYQMFEFFKVPTLDNTTPFNFSISTKRFNPYINQGHKCKLAYVDLYCTALPGGEITVQHFIDDQNNPIITKTVEIFSRGVIGISSITPGSPTTIVTISDHGLITGEQVTFGSIVGSIGTVLNNQTFTITKVDNITFTITQNTNSFVYTTAGYIYNAVLGNSASAKYYRIYLGAIAHFHQLVFTLSDAQLADTVKSSAQFEMQGLVCWFRKEGRIRG